MGMHHDHGHCHPPAGKKHLAWAALITGLFMIVEITGGVISGSLALIADAGHMMTDFAALSLAWLALILAHRPATARYPFGFKRLPILAAFVNAVSLIFIALFICIEAVRRFYSPGEILAGTMLWIAIIGLLVNVLVFIILSRGGADNLNMRGAILHVIGDMLGSVAAIIAALIIMLTGFTLIDPLLSLFVALLIGWSGYRLMRQSAHILLQGAPDSLDKDKVTKGLLKEFPELSVIHSFQSWSLSDHDHVVALRVGIHKNHDAQDIQDRLKQFLDAQFHVHNSMVEISKS